MRQPDDQPLVNACLATLGNLPKSDDPEQTDIEDRHIIADHALLTLLSDLGYDEVVQAWHATGEKWYA